MAKSTSVLLSFVIVSSLLLAACQPQEENAAATAETSTLVETPSTEAENGGVSIAKTVATEATYQSPAGEEKVGFTIAVDAEGMITNAETQVMAQAPISVTRQESFAAEFPTVLVGKKLSELTQVDRIGGSSLTTGAFNEALVELKAQL